MIVINDTTNVISFVIVSSRNSFYINENIMLVNILKYKRIQWFTDNQNVVSIIAKDSIKLELQDIALCIFKNCVQHNMFIDVEWTPYPVLLASI
jgi:hypothetical protein